MVSNSLDPPPSCPDTHYNIYLGFDHHLPFFGIDLPNTRKVCRWPTRVNDDDTRPDLRQDGHRHELSFAIDMLCVQRAEQSQTKADDGPSPSLLPVCTRQTQPTVNELRRRVYHGRLTMFFTFNSTAGMFLKRRLHFDQGGLLDGRPV